MFSWRITKYNPQFRNTQGHYLKDEWISFSNIGHMYENKIFTIEEYLNTEDKYVHAILSLMKCLNINTLHVYKLEKYRTIKNTHYLSQEMIDCFNNIYDNQNTDEKKN